MCFSLLGFFEDHHEEYLFIGIEGDHASLEHGRQNLDFAGWFFVGNEGIRAFYKKPTREGVYTSFPCSLLRTRLGPLYIYIIREYTGT